MPFKGLLEEWYVDNANIIVYIKLIFLTLLMLINYRPEVIWRMFKNLPGVPSDIELTD